MMNKTITHRRAVQGPHSPAAQQSTSAYQNGVEDLSRQRALVESGVWCASSKLRRRVRVRAPCRE